MTTATGQLVTRGGATPEGIREALLTEARERLGAHLAAEAAAAAGDEGARAAVADVQELVDKLRVTS